MFLKIKNCAEQIKKITNFTPRVAVVLGSGLGEYANKITKVCEIPYNEINGFPTSTVAGHNGRFVFGYVDEVPVVIMQGRVHYYEGYSMSDVVLPIRVMGLLGAKTLVLTNAAGGINQNFNVGDFMVITDHISTFVKSVLIGENITELGTRFPDMSEVYDKKLANDIMSFSPSIKSGVYTQLTGPQYETPAEIRMLKILGADAVGMSTVCEAVAAKHMGMKVAGISLITNMATGINKTPLSHKEVQDTAERVKNDFQNLLTHTILKAGEIQ